MNHSISRIIVSRRGGYFNASITLDKYGNLIPHMQEGAAKLMDEPVMPIEVELNK